MTTGAIDDGLDERDIRILNSTEELIAEHGYNRVRLIDIADRAGVSIGSLQHRYRTRDALLRTAVQRVTAVDLPPLLSSAASVEDPYERVLAIIEHLMLQLDPTQPSSLLWLELVVTSWRHPELREVLREGNAAWHASLRDTLQEAIDRGRIETDFDATELATTLLALVDGFSIVRIIGANAGDEPEKLLKLARGVLDGLVTVSD